MHRVPTRHHLDRLTHLDRATGHVIRRYEHAKPGDMIHVDIKKLGNIPDGGGHRMLGRHAGTRNRSAMPGVKRVRRGEPVLGYQYLHNAVDNHSRLAYTEILTDETKETATAFSHAPRPGHTIRCPFSAEPTRGRRSTETRHSQLRRC